MDVKDKCIDSVGSVRKSLRYFSLSYIWGKQPFLNLTKQNISSLEVWSALANEDLPRTIREAIAVTDLFGERYIGLTPCAFFKTAMKISNSRSCIWTRSTLQLRLPWLRPTVIAFIRVSWMSRADPVVGSRLLKALAAFDLSSMATTCQCPTIGRMELQSLEINLLEARAHIHQGAGVLSLQYQEHQRRHLHGRVDQWELFAHSPCSADKVRSPFMVSRQSPLSGSTPSIHNSSEWVPYKSLVSDLTVRNLTHDADIVRSMAGILQLPASINPEKYTCCLPASMLEWALSWQPTGPLRRRKASCWGHPFPSCSWAGWVGSVEYPEGACPNVIDLVVDG